MPPVKKVKPAAKTSKKEADTATATPVVSGQLDKKIKKQQRKAVDKRGVVFIKHLPHGFFEEQLKSYFSQFGNVTRLRLSRSKRTGGSKGFAFVEFEYPEVAQVAAETMDNYLMFKKVVKASYIPPEKQRFNYFKSTLRRVKNKAGKEIYVSGKTAATQKRVKNHNDWSDEVYQRRTAKKLTKVKRLNKKYAHLGIDFSNVLIQPKRLTADEKAQKVIDDKNAAEVKSAIAKESTTNKREHTTEIVADAKKGKKSKKQENKVELQDLLGNTINDDSEDEDYIAIPEIDMESDEEDESDDDSASISSNEETYGFAKDSDSELADVDETPIKKKSSFGKKLKPSSKVDRFEQLIKRKPHAGAIQKVKKNQKKPVAAKGKSSMQITAAKELVKALPVKGKNKNMKAKTTKKQKV